MANKHHKPEEIVAKLRQVEVLVGQGMARVDAIREVSITEQTYYRWRKKYGGSVKWGAPRSATRFALIPEYDDFVSCDKIGSRHEFSRGLHIKDPLTIPQKYEIRQYVTGILLPSSILLGITAFVAGFFLDKVAIESAKTTYLREYLQRLGAFEQRLDQTEDQSESLEVDLTAAQALSGQLRQEIDTAAARITGVQSRISALGQPTEDLEALRRQIDDLKTSSEVIEAIIKQIESVEDIADQVSQNLSVDADFQNSVRPRPPQLTIISNDRTLGGSPTGGKTRDVKFDCPPGHVVTGIRVLDRDTGRYAVSAITGVEVYCSPIFLE